MQYIDPCLVTCPCCGEERKYAVADLLALRAFCVDCGGDLAAVGRDMRKELDDWSLFCLRVEIAMELEKIFGIPYEDSEIWDLMTVGDFLDLSISKVS